MATDSAGNVYVTDRNNHRIQKFSPAGVLSNDYNPDGDPLDLDAVLDSDVSNGTLALDLEGSFTYAPNTDFHGTDTFTYHANNGTDDSNIATVTITVPISHGYLRATTNPAVPAQILIDGTPRDSWGLNWAKLDPGDYEVSFTDIQGFTTLESQIVTITTDNTTVVQGDYVERGSLRVITSPPVAATIYLDDIPRNDWGMWTDLEAGTYEVCFGSVPGYTPPACQPATLIPEALTTITGTYIPNP